MRHLLDSILYFVNFWACNLALPLKRNIDASVLTCARKKLRSPAPVSSQIVGVSPLSSSSASAGDRSCPALISFSGAHLDGKVIGWMV